MKNKILRFITYYLFILAVVTSIELLLIYVLKVPPKLDNLLSYSIYLGLVSLLSCSFYLLLKYAAKKSNK